MKSKRHHKKKSGFALQIAFLMIIVIIPMAALFVLWLRVHTKQSVQSRIHLKQYYLDKSGVDIARYQILANNSDFGGTTWSSGQTKEVKVNVDPDTSVDIIIQHRGFNYLDPANTLW